MAIRFAHYQKLTVYERYEFGLILRSKEEEDVLLPKAELEGSSIRVGDSIEVFIYSDRAGKLAATLKKPKALPGEIALLKVKEVNLGGIWLDWGLHFDLKLPEGEITTDIDVGDKVLVKVIADPIARVFFATNKIDPYLSPAEGLNRGDQVIIQYYRPTPMGYSVIVNDAFLGLIHLNNSHGMPQTGYQTKAWVDSVRPDGKLDILLKAPGFTAAKDDLSDLFLKVLKAEGGQTSLGDKSDADEISRVFSMSKKSFKKTAGNLFKEGIIQPAGTGWSLSQSTDTVL